MSDINEHVIITTNPSVEVWLAAACLMHYNFHSPKPVALAKDTKILPQELLNGEDVFIIGRHSPAVRFSVDLMNKGSSVTLISRGSVSISFSRDAQTHEISNELLEIMHKAYPLLSHPMMAYGCSNGECNGDFDYPLPPIIRAVQSAFLFERGLVTSIEECHSTLYNLLEEYIKQEPLPEYKNLEDLFNMDSVELYYWLRNQVKEPEPCITLTDIKRPDNPSLDFVIKNDQVAKVEEKTRATEVQKDSKPEVQEEHKPIPPKCTTTKSDKPVTPKQSNPHKMFKHIVIPGKGNGLIPKQTMEVVPVQNMHGEIYGHIGDKVYKDTTFKIYDININGFNKYEGGCFTSLSKLKVGVIDSLPNIMYCGKTSTPDLFKLLKNDLQVDIADELDIVIGVRGKYAKDKYNYELHVLVYSRVPNICLQSDDGKFFTMFTKNDRYNNNHLELVFDYATRYNNGIIDTFTLQNPDSLYTLKFEIVSISESGVATVNTIATKKLRQEDSNGNPDL
ncbi:hypothetical protein [Bacteroides acidifaciens]|uniref:hypothetical protein n=1 Tax=Bacteroides acidifaciens TaxID=85831 RepID=UPI0026E94B3A|nr:hypothetical protein [Bacteroides acidifaciens]